MVVQELTRSRTRRLVIDGREVSDDTDCYVIAEIGHNHQGSVEQALRLVEAAHRAGADAVKVQKRDNKTLYTRDFYDGPYRSENSFGPTYGAHREALELDRAAFVEMQAFARHLGIAFFATPFDLPSLELLADLDMPAYKVASADLRNTPLLERIAQLGRPVVMSTGGAEMEDVERGYELLASGGADVAVLQCTVGYPARWAELDLRVVTTYRERFPEAVVGYSGHDNGGASAATAAFALGARIVEKHVTLDRSLRGTDQRFSLEPPMLMEMVEELRRVRSALGSPTKRVHAREREPWVKMAKKIVVDRDLPVGHVLAWDDLAFRSPGDGLSPCDVRRVLGRPLRAPLTRDAAVSLEILGEPAISASA
jgi:sialic acid synthase